MYILPLTLLSLLGRFVAAAENDIIWHQTMRNTVMSAIQDSADFAIKIHPPKEDTQETLRSLDGIMMLEDALRRATIDDFADAEQRLLQVHKAKIKQLVADAMEPIHAMLHLPSYAPSSTGEF